MVDFFVVCFWCVVFELFECVWGLFEGLFVYLFEVFCCCVMKLCVGCYDIWVDVCEYFDFGFGCFCEEDCCVVSVGFYVDVMFWYVR